MLSDLSIYFLLTWVASLHFICDSTNRFAVSFWLIFTSFYFSSLDYAWNVCTFKRNSIRKITKMILSKITTMVEINYKSTNTFQFITFMITISNLSFLKIKNLSHQLLHRRKYQIYIYVYFCMWQICMSESFEAYFSTN